ncbi:Hypothetical predicted protein [Olea europaea subsp. europaea]|uniref:Uncharacterized protein n=1 Tax=Olea europaea subsp. europaea TaxID=158383 RepID=A0A8S0V0Y4_OLEEU|nr:Hypothetical predicted protein [Olea europaea subsp. europaea]
MKKIILKSWIDDSLANGELGNGASNRIEQKRAHQWSMDKTEQEPYSNKKQAVESAKDKPASGTANMNISLLGNTSSSQSGQTGNCIFHPKPIRILKFPDKNVSLVQVLNRVKGSEDQVEIDSPICLPVSRDEEH